MNANLSKPKVMWYYILALFLFIMTIFFLLEALGTPARGLYLLLVATLNACVSLILVLLRRWGWAKWSMISNTAFLLGGIAISLILT
jgi:hypothetical protein